MSSQSKSGPSGDARRDAERRLDHAAEHQLEAQGARDDVIS